MPVSPWIEKILLNYTGYLTFRKPSACRRHVTSDLSQHKRDAEKGSNEENSHKTVKSQEKERN